MKTQLKLKFLTEEEQEFARVSPILEFYYSLLAKARELKKQEQENEK